MMAFANSCWHYLLLLLLLALQLLLLLLLLALQLLMLLLLLALQLLLLLLLLPLLLHAGYRIFILQLFATIVGLIFNRFMTQL